MRRNIFLFVLIAGLIIISGCTRDKDDIKVNINNNPLDSINSVNSKEDQYKVVSKKVGHIDFGVVLIDEDNFEDLNIEFDDELDKNDLVDNTLIILKMNNHRTDLSIFDYQKMSKLDGVLAKDWQQFGSRVGGHHVVGLLFFSKLKNPSVLIIDGLPVEQVILEF